MRKDEVLKLLTQHKPELARRFGVTDLALFGSSVRDEARPDSDLMFWSASTGLPRRSAILACSFIWKIYWDAR